MRVIIAGGRNITSYDEVVAAVETSGFHVTEVVSGGARGVDRLGEIWAERQKPPIPVGRFPADWENHGKGAGFRRNEEMAEYAEALVAVWDGESRGTGDMIRRAQKHGLSVYIHRVGPGEARTADIIMRDVERSDT